MKKKEGPDHEDIGKAMQAAVDRAIIYKNDVSRKDGPEARREESEVTQMLDSLGTKGKGRLGQMGTKAKGRLGGEPAFDGRREGAFGRRTKELLKKGPPKKQPAPRAFPRKATRWSA